MRIYVVGIGVYVHTFVLEDTYDKEMVQSKTNSIIGFPLTYQ